jgi:phenylacetate-coenzyme A ligase PaaK-like adenylate-forming protein
VSSRINIQQITEIQGRKNDKFILPSGRVMPKRTFSIISIELKRQCVSHIQIIQDRRDHLLVKTVKGTEFDPHVIDRIITQIRTNLAEDGVSVDHHYVESIPRTNTEKRKYRVSYIT